ncbi:hypothetical protein ABNF97_09450 [Plantactinospora sp. B6F1]|uniref:hypothetical protein n=1 Tax=Plantactinospora sp. B6F1 TaxID=3158971 RepID=UPI0032D97B18
MNLQTTGTGIDFLVEEAPQGSNGPTNRAWARSLRDMADKPTAVVITSHNGDHVSLVLCINRALADFGYRADSILRGLLSGRGGGNAYDAQFASVPVSALPDIPASLRAALS